MKKRQVGTVRNASISLPPRVLQRKSGRSEHRGQEGQPGSSHKRKQTSSEQQQRQQPSVLLRPSQMLGERRIQEEPWGDPAHLSPTPMSGQSAQTYAALATGSVINLCEPQDALIPQALHKLCARPPPPPEGLFLLGLNYAQGQRAARYT